MGIQIRGTDDNISASDGSLTINGASFSTLQVNGQNLPTAGPLSNRNLVINGAMQVAQRGTSFTPATEFGYTLDRYITFFTNTGSVNLTQETSSPPEGHTTYARITSTGAASVTGRNLFSQIVEGQNLAPTKWGYSDAKDVTISFWVRSSLTGDFGFAVNATTQNRCIVMKYNIASANTWEHKTLLIPATTSGDFGLTSSGRGCWLFWDLGTSSANEYGTTDTWVDSSTKYTATNVQQLITVSGATLDITGVQLEVGTVATPFEHRSYGDELARCQRYYYRIGGGSLYNHYGVAVAYDADALRLNIPFAVSMRSIPTSIDVLSQGQFLAERDASLNHVSSSITLSGNSSTEMGFLVIDSSTNFSTGGVAYNVYAYNTANTFVGFSAEL